ncbi:SUKH-4 family immunity protein [Streptomyces sp. NBC_00390]|uniref:SUKH-4 family immunity protein n=1 Tax=Streptomyces sp. NBC_00390 TaxID=2975736 RepID=UPI002E1C5FB2
MAGTIITVPEGALHPAITHEATRRWLAESGLQDGHSLMRFSPAEAPTPTVRQYLLTKAANAAPDRLDAYIADLLVVGHLLIDSYEADEVVLDGTTGRVFSMWLYEESPQNAELFPLAPSLEALTRFLTAIDEFGGLCGGFAGLAGKTGAQAVAAASALLMSVFTDEEWGDADWGSAGPRSGWDHEIPAFWRMAALIRPMALIAGPGKGLRLDLPKGLLDEEFGADEVVRVAPSRLPAALEHEPTRRFLTEVGLPQEALMFWMDEEETLLLSLPEDRERSKQNPDHDHLWNGTDELPPEAEHLLVLGGLMHDFTVLIDGRTGAVHYAEYDADRVVPVNADISTLAFTVWMHSRQQDLEEEHDFTDDFYHQLADTMIATLASVDPVACLPATDPDDFRYWPEVFHDEAGGVL